jgi:hypothetical protein
MIRPGIGTQRKLTAAQSGGYPLGNDMELGVIALHSRLEQPTQDSGATKAKQ